MKLRGLWWWIDRWRKSTAYTDMTLEEQGAYRNLLDDAALRGGPLPDDENVLAKACGDPRRWRRVRPKVMIHFQLKADGWHNATLDEVLRESERRSTKQADYRARIARDIPVTQESPPDNTPGNGIGNRQQHTVHLMDPETDPEKLFVRSSEGDSQGETAAPLDVWLGQLQADYPENRVTYSYLTSSAFCDVFAKDDRPSAVVWAELQANLENQKRGHEWRVKGMVPKLDKWLREGLWKQHHEEHPPATPDSRTPAWIQRTRHRP